MYAQERDPAPCREPAHSNKARARDGESRAFFRTELERLGDVIRHEARLSRAEVDGAPLRAHLEVAARKGNAAAIRELAGPEIPASVAHLRVWLYELHGRSGIGMGGVAPLTFRTIADWADAYAIEPKPTPDEYAALMMLDTLLLTESQPKKPKNPPDATTVRQRRRV